MFLRQSPRCEWLSTPATASARAAERRRPAAAKAFFQARTGLVRSSRNTISHRTSTFSRPLEPSPVAKRRDPCKPQGAAW
jgi:hypothetical protein